MKLQNKVAIVTGGASGIGEATVRLMVKQGARVVIADMNNTKGVALAEELNKNGIVALYVPTNVTVEDEVKNVVKQAVDAFGKLDIMFANAGIGAMSAVVDMPMAEWNRVIGINITGVMMCDKYAIEAMLKTGGGVVINTASILGFVGQAGTTAYSAAKGAVVNITKTIALDYAKQGVRAVGIAPGYIETPLLSDLDKQLKDYLVTLHPMGRLGTAEEIANAVVFLASDDASFITGTTLLVDGGYTAQ